MHNNKLTAKLSRVKSAVINATRTGIAIQRGRGAVVLSMLLGYTIRRAVCSTAVSFMCATMKAYVASRLGDYPHSCGHCAYRACFAGAQWHLLRAFGRNYDYGSRSGAHDRSGTRFDR